MSNSVEIICLHFSSESEGNLPTEGHQKLNVKLPSEGNLHSYSESEYLLNEIHLPSESKCYGALM